MKKKTLSILLISFVSIVILIFIFQSQLYHFHKENKLNLKIDSTLFSLGKESLPSLDVPISAVIIYSDSIIGKGYNDVFKNNNAAGHAEINAISDALKKLGYKKFMNLNRDSLFLISTFEPCPMCKGAIQLYKIRNVEFLKDKSISYWWKSSIGDFLYELHKRKVGNEFLQDSLFRMHPIYKNELKHNF